MSADELWALVEEYADLVALCERGPSGEAYTAERRAELKRLIRAAVG